MRSKPKRLGPVRPHSFSFVIFLPIRYAAAELLKSVNRAVKPRFKIRKTLAPKPAAAGRRDSARGASYWRQRLIHRPYREARFLAQNEYSARIEHEGSFYYFP